MDNGQNDSAEIIIRDGGGDVISLQFLGVEDVNVDLLTSDELILYALANLKSDCLDGEGGYAIQYGRSPIFDLLIESQD